MLLIELSPGHLVMFFPLRKVSQTMTTTKWMALPAHLPDNRVLAVEVGGRPVGIAKVNGQWHAFEDYCTHAAC